MASDSSRSPAAKGRSPYPERAALVDADTASAGREIERTADDLVDELAAKVEAGFDVEGDP
jgi:hypothetical protein